MAILPTELLFSMGRLTAILSLLLIVILILLVIFLLFFHQRHICEYDENDQPNEVDPTLSENKQLELATFQQYSSTDNNPTSSINSTNINMNEQMSHSTSNLISASE